MDEFIPVALGVVFGWLLTTSRARFALCVGAVLASALFATVLSGEYRESWIDLLLDLGEAALGLGLGIAIAIGVERHRARNKGAPNQPNMRPERDVNQP